MKNDVQIQKEVVAELNHEQGIVAGAIGVEVHHGVVKLAGHVGDDAIRENSETAAHRVDGVTSVLMDVDVTGKESKTASLG